MKHICNTNVDILGVNVQTTATIAKELLRAGTSPTADALAKQDQHIGK